MDLCVGQRVRWMSHIPWHTYMHRYAAHIPARVVGLGKTTVHIEVTRACGTRTQRWVKRARVMPIEEK